MRADDKRAGIQGLGKLDACTATHKIAPLLTAEREQGTHSAEVVVAGTLAVELARAEVDVLHARPPISEKHTVTNNNRRKHSKLSLILQRA